MTAAEEILVLGHHGLLGRAVMEACGPGCRVIAGGRDSFDLARMGRPASPVVPAATSALPGSETDQSLDWLRDELTGLGPSAADLHAGLDHLASFLASGQVRLVINCAGYTDVDRAESEPEAALAANTQGAGAVARLCARHGVRLVHLSTDYVFDGQTRRPYREDDPARPLSVYGRSKLEGERLVREHLPSALIVRSAWLFGPGRDNFISKVLAQARVGRPFTVVDDQVGSPTYTLDLALALVTLGRRGASGLLHLVNAGQASRHELARQALAIAGLDPELVRPTTTAALAAPAARPAWSVLDGRRAARLLGQPQPTWLDALRRHLQTPEENKA